MNKFFTQITVNKVLTLLILLCASINRLSGQSSESTNYKTGIDVTFLGTPGVDYQEEYLYSDKLISDRKIVYIRDTTQISLSHNARNVSYAGSGLYAAATTDNPGVILYKIDRDLQYNRSWGDGGGADNFYDFNGNATKVPRVNNPTYEAPFSFASLQYTSQVPVVGTVGPVPGVAVTDAANYFWRGIKDDVGDEWHVLTVADSDSFVKQSEGRASDGKIILFVVNPKTPCLTITTTGDAQFYTTPAKIYFIPKINDQTTYFSARNGTVNFTLTDLEGKNIFYRINGGPWLGGSKNLILNNTAFKSGSNTLQYYYDGNADYTKVRKIVKDPDYPSSQEKHGDLLWGSSAQFYKIAKRLSSSPYAAVFKGIETNSLANPLTSFDNNYHKGRRIGYGKAAIANAFVAKIKGWDINPNGKSKSYALYAKQMLLDSERNIDPVGFELNNSGRALPTRELYYRGYYDVNATLSMAFAYDLLIANFKSTQFPEGITAIEDYFIRDELASCAFDGMMHEGNYSFKEYKTSSMWPTARIIGALVVAMAIPSYSTPYYGTSGFDGNTTVYPYTPFPDSPLTWKKVFLDNDAPLLGYPNLNYRFGVEEYMISQDGSFTDRIPYYDYPLMGHCFFTLANITKLYTSVSYPRLEISFGRAVEGTLVGLKNPSEGPSRFSCITLLNDKFPNIARIGIPFIKSPGASGDRESSGLYQAGVYGLVWYDNVAPPSNVKIKIDGGH